MIPSRYPDALSFFAALAAMADELREEIIPLADIERRELLTRTVANCDMVLGVWPNGDEAGVGVLVIKGRYRMPPLELRLAERS